MRISVAMATYNGTKYIEEQLQSIVGQTRVPDEIVICDDCSSDNTIGFLVDFVGRHKEIDWIVHQNESNQGYIRNYFNAITRTSGDLVVLSDQDDIWDAHKLERFEDWFESHADMLSLHTDYTVIDQNGKVIRGHVIGYQSGVTKYTVESFCDRLNYSGMSTAFRSSLKPRLLALNPDDIPTHDWTIHALAVVGNGMYVSDYVSSYRRYTGNNVALSIEKRVKREGVPQRIGVVQNYENHYRLLASLAAEYGNAKVENRASELIDICDERVGSLSNQSLLGWVRYLIKALRTMPPKAYLCDALYIVGYY